MNPEQYGRLEQIFEAAVALVSGERNAFLSSLAKSEPELAEAVAALLSADARSASFIDEPVMEQTPESLLRRLADSMTAPGDPGEQEPALEADRLLGPYRLLERLGRGGMGVVYRAEHVDTGAQVAVKTIQAPERALLSSLRREIRALARIRHPAIVRILDDGLDHGLPWYAMELLEGTSLNRFWEESSGAERKEAEADIEALPSRAVRPGDVNGTRLAPPVAGPAVPAAAAWWTDTLRHSTSPTPGPGERRSPRPPRRRARTKAAAGQMELALRLVRQICAPLSYLHGEGLVHRDLKPQNILVRPDGSTVLIDFGLLATFSQEISREALELEALRAGTVAYMAPEQIRGESCDARADLYSLGCIFFELLTGRRPFTGRDLATVAEAHLSRTPVPPSHLVEGVPAGLDELVLQLLAKDPRQRLGHADDLAAALQRLGAPPQPAGEPQARAYLYRPGFSGRDQELALLRERLARLGRGPGGVVFVGGASGIGKTRLGLELAREATLQGIEVLTGESRPPEQQGGGDVLGPLRRPLQQLADRCRERGLAEAERVFGVRGALLAAYEPSLTTLPGFERHPAVTELPPREARLRLYRALAEVFEAVAGGQSAGALPLLLVLDDLQWADGLTLGFLESLMRYPPLIDPKPGSQGLRLMVLGLYRAEEADDALRALFGSPHALHRELGRLEPEAVGSMVAQMLALALPPARFSRFLDRHAEGNPFFVAEYLRAAVAESLLWRDERGAWQVAEPGAHAAEEPDYEALTLPRSLRELVLRRLRGLPEPALRLAEAASVVGRESDALLLRSVLELEGRALDDAVQELLRRQVLEEPSAGRLRFVHDKLREVAYEQILPETRPGLHRAAAGGIEAMGQTDQRMAELGHHWEQAQDGARARLCYLAAARQAAERYAHEDAERLYLAYLRLADQPSLERISARNELGDKVLRSQGRNDAARQQHEQAFSEARSLGALALEGESLCNLGFLAWSTGRTDEARGLYEQSLGLLRRAGDRKNEGVALFQLAILHHHQGNREVALPLFEQALGISREVGDRRREGHVLGNLANLHRDQGRPEQAQQLFDQALRVSREAGDRLREGSALGQMGFLFHTQGRLAEAQPLYEQALRLGRETGSRLNEGIALGFLAILRYDQGRLDEAANRYEQALVLFRQIGDRRNQSITMHNLASVNYDQGRLDEARQQYEQTLSLFRQIGDRRHEGIALGELAGLSKDQGRMEEARKLYEEALAIHREVHGRRFEGMVLRGLAELLLLSTGRPQQAAELAYEAEAILEALGDKLELAMLRCCQGHIALAAGHSGSELLQQAEALTVEAGAGPRSRLGQHLERLRRAVEASGRGGHERLCHGQLLEDLTAGVRGWLIQNGHLAVGAVPQNEPGAPGEA